MVVVVFHNRRVDDLNGCSCLKCTKKYFAYFQYYNDVKFLKKDMGISV